MNRAARASKTLHTTSLACFFFFSLSRHGQALYSIEELDDEQKQETIPLTSSLKQYGRSLSGSRCDSWAGGRRGPDRRDVTPSV